jgi:glycosyltransferase involved in cell wall biosynthesis
MNTLFISTSDLHGGAAIAAFRLMNALQAEGMNVNMLVRDKRSSNNNVIEVGSKTIHEWNFLWERGKIFMANRFSRKNLFDISIANTGVSVTELPEFQHADIIHLHWINQGMLSLKELNNIFASGKKVVWTMHDMWPFTGICHHAGDCTHYQQACGRCPYLVGSSPHDLSHKVFKRKHVVYSSGNITFVACSNWLKNQAEKSPLTAAHRVLSIPNPIDTRHYRPKDKISARKKLQLPLDKKIVLFAAVKTSDKRKGTDYLIEASRLMKQHTDNVLFLIAGNNGKDIETRFALPTQSIGYVAPENMPEIYNAADVFVTPSLQENLPNTIMEAMACGTPCIGFRIGGIPEMIEHLKTGYIAEYKNANDLANGLFWTLFEADTETLSANAREKTVKTYAQEIIAEQYKKVYDQ